jgi:DNA-binding MarR family transcriptional regulator
MGKRGPLARSGTGSGQVAFLVAQVGGLAAQRFAERVAPLGLSPARAGLMRAVAAEPGRSQQAMSVRLGLLPSRLVVLVDELEGDGLLERRRDPGDRRNYALYVTPAGEDRLSEIGRAVEAHGEDFLAPLDKTERATLAALLTKLATHHELTPDVHPGYRVLGRDADPKKG